MSQAISGVLELAPPATEGPQAVNVWVAECKHRLGCRGRGLECGGFALVAETGTELHSFRVVCVGGNSRAAWPTLRNLSGTSGRHTENFGGENLSFSVKEGALTCTVPAPASTLPLQA